MELRRVLFGFFQVNVLMTSVEFGMANQFILDLKANTKRGLYAKAKRGDYPGNAPIGYLNDTRIKQVAVDRKKSKAVRRAFELYAEGNWRGGKTAPIFSPKTHKKINALRLASLNQGEHFVKDGASGHFRGLLFCELFGDGNILLFR